MSRRPLPLRQLERHHTLTDIRTDPLIRCPDHMIERPITHILDPTEGGTLTKESRLAVGRVTQGSTTRQDRASSPLCLLDRCQRACHFYPAGNNGISEGEYDSTCCLALPPTSPRHSSYYLNLRIHTHPTLLAGTVQWKYILDSRDPSAPSKDASAHASWILISANIAARADLNICAS